MKAFFAVLAIFICPTFAFGDTIGPSTGCANSAYVGDTYKLNLINYSGDQLAGDSIFGVADFSDRTANSISGQEDQIHSLALNSKILITRMRLRYLDGGVHDWSASTDNEKSFRYALRGESSESAAHAWKPFLTTYKSSVWADEDESDLFARDTTDDFFRYAGSLANPTWFEDRKDKSGSGKNDKKATNVDRGKYGGDDGEKGSRDDGGKGGSDDGGKGDDGGGSGDDGHTRKIPEPSSLMMLGTGLLIGGSLLRKFVG